MPDYDEDPGWPVSWRLGVIALFPPSVFLFVRTRRLDLGALRQYFMATCLSILSFGRTISVLPIEDHGKRHPMVAIGAVALASYGAVMARFVPAPLLTDDDHKLAHSYTMRFFIRVAFAMSGALFGFVAFFLSNERWAFGACIPMTLVGLYFAAPTRTRLAGDQRRIEESGSRLSLVHALQSA